jgi:hypothetical protein
MTWSSTEKRYWGGIGSVAVAVALRRRGAGVGGGRIGSNSRGAVGLADPVEKCGSKP